MCVSFASVLTGLQFPFSTLEFPAKGESRNRRGVEVINARLIVLVKGVLKK